MPFDRIAVTMKVRRLYDCGIDMYFEYFRVDSNWDRVKLAHGDHKVAWVSIDGDDTYVPQKLPSLYFKALHNRDQHKHG
jgi:enediyne polyketide synthase